MLWKILKVIDEELDGQKAWEYTREINQRDRWFTFSKMYESARYVADQLIKLGLEDVEIIDAPADGETLFEDTPTNQAWDAEEAILDIVKADGSREAVADYQKTPCNLVMYSAPTPPEGLETELVPIDDGTRDEDYRGLDVSGKLLLTTAHGPAVKPLAVKHGALGVVSSYMWNPDLSDEVYWENQWSDVARVWGYLKVDTPLVGFNVSPNTGRRLRAMVEKNGGMLRVFVRVKSRLYDGTFPIVTGIIPGVERRKEEVILIGHMYEQGATDNAGGCGVRVEIARALMSLIRLGKLPRPKRSIRFIFNLEAVGSTFYAVKYRQRMDNAVAVLEIDGAGDDHVKCRNPMGVVLSENTGAAPSYMDAMILRILDRYLIGSRGHYFTWWTVPSYHVIRSWVGSEAFILAFSTGMPAARFGHANYFWHTTADTMDKSNPRNLKYLGVIVATCAYFIANAGEKESIYLAHLSASRGKSEIANATQQEIERLADSDPSHQPEAFYDSLDQIGFVRDTQLRAMESVLRLVPRGGRKQVATVIRGLKRSLRKAAAAEVGRLAEVAGLPRSAVRERPEKGLSYLEEQLQSIVPQRKNVAFLSRLARVPKDQWEGHQPSIFVTKLLYWCDDKRNLLEACRLTAREVRLREGGTTPTLEEIGRRLGAREQNVLEYFKFLKKYGYVDW